MLPLRKLGWFAIAAAAFAACGCSSPNAVTFENRTSQDLEIALLGPALEVIPSDQPSAEYVPPIHQLPKGGRRTFELVIDWPKGPAGAGNGEAASAAALPAAFSWKAGLYEGDLLFIKGERAEKGEKLVALTAESIPPPEERGDPNWAKFQANLNQVLQRFKGIREAVKHPASEIWQDPDLKALEPLRTAQVKSPDSPEAHRKQLTENLRPTVANGFQAVGERHADSTNPRDLLIAAGCFIRARDLDCPRAQAAIDKLRAKVQASFSADWKRLKNNAVISCSDLGTGKEYRLYFEHELDPPVFASDALHYRIVIRYGRAKGFDNSDRKGSVSYGDDLVIDNPPSVITLGQAAGKREGFSCLKMVSDPSQPWPKDLRLLWQCLQVLSKTRAIGQVLVEEAAAPAVQPIP